MYKKITENFHKHILERRELSVKLDIFIASILLLLFFATPLLSANFNFGYEKIKVIFFLAVISIGGFVFFLGTFIKPSHFNIKLTPINKAAILFLSVLTISALFGINFASSIFGNEPYLQGLIVYSYLYLMYLMVKTIPIHTRVWSQVLTFSSVLVSAWAIKEFIQLHLYHEAIPTYAGRVVGSFGQPNLYSGFILLTLPFTLSLVSKQTQKGKIFLLLLLFIQIAGVIVSFSRASIILLLPLILFWFIKKFHDRIVFWLITVFTLITFASVGISFYFSSGIIQNEIIAPMETKWMGPISPEKRYYIWYVIFESIRQRPLLGYGLDTLVWEFGKRYDPKTAQPAFYHSVKDLVVDRSHNYLLDLLVFSGVIGLLSWGYLIYQLFRKDKSKLLGIWLIFYLIWIQFQIQGIVHLMLFWLVVALIDKGEKESY